ncbi:MAG: TOBE domain-containing protein, partial [Bifidobacteriales bacterium]|nr:TOBE domain-containing protein [Bifidobacteriales bacterium]
MPARILTMREQGYFEVLVKLELGDNGKGAHFLSRLTRHSWQILGLREGMDVYTQIKGVALIDQQEG